MMDSSSTICSGYLLSPIELVNIEESTVIPDNSSAILVNENTSNASVKMYLYITFSLKLFKYL